MNRILLTVAMLIALASPSSGRTFWRPPPKPVPTPPPTTGWTSTFDDEFNAGETLSTNWILNQQDNGNGELQTFSAAQASIVDGALQLQAIKSGTKYISAQVISKFTQAQGRFEARVKIPTGKGIWPDFWLNADALPWPNGGEVDAFENIGSSNYYSSAFHWNGNPGYLAQYNTNTPAGLNLATWNTFAIEWDAQQIRYYLNDVLHWVVNKPSGITTGWNSLQNIRFSLPVGGSYPGNPDSNTFANGPLNFDIDYIRVWKAGTGTAASVGVPEPATIWLVILVVVVIGGYMLCCSVIPDKGE
jgi:beta-glucanase (GH16 family)